MIIYALPFPEVKPPAVSGVILHELYIDAVTHFSWRFGMIFWGIIKLV